MGTPCPPLTSSAVPSVAYGRALTVFALFGPSAAPLGLVSSRASAPPGDLFSPRGLTGALRSSPELILGGVRCSVWCSERRSNTREAAGESEGRGAAGSVTCTGGLSARGEAAERLGSLAVSLV